MRNMAEMQKMLKAAKEMQDRLQKELAGMRVEGTSGGGMVTVVLDGQKTLLSIRIEKEVVNKDDVDMLQDLVVAAFNDAAAKVDGAARPKAGEPRRRPEDPGDVLMFEYAQPLHDLIEELKRIPGIGAKTAQRMAFYVLGLPQEDADRLAEAIREAKRKIFTCSVCNNITHVDPCQMCTDPHRQDDVLCVVEEPFNISSIEKTGVYHGRYHVLLGALSPLKGMGPDELHLEKFIKRIEAGQVPGGHRRHQSHRGRRGDGPLSGEAPEGHRPQDHEAGHGPARRARTSISPTRSRSRKPWKAGPS